MINEVRETRRDVLRARAGLLRWVRMWVRREHFEDNELVELHTLGERLIEAEARARHVRASVRGAR